MRRSIKEAGDFTATIGRTQPEDTAAVHGPFGRFSHLLYPDESDLVFLAGGIGITPLMAMLRHMRDTGDARTVTLFYANRREEDILQGKKQDKNHAQTGTCPGSDPTDPLLDS